jgi:F0F1-type ATP synthase membrane subunit c/vacuolar-type H+-ATPase subunit K
MKIRLLITVFCFALIQFQGRAAIISGNYFAPIAEAGSSVPLDFFYTIVTPSPDYILYFPFMGVPIFSSFVSSVLVNGVSAPFIVVNTGPPGIYIKLQNPSLAVAGAKIVINSSIFLSPFAGQFLLGPIQTAANGGTIIDNTSGPVGQPIIVMPTRVTFLATTAITNNGFTVNWVSSPGADSYHLDISTSPSFTTFLTGYNNLNVGNVLTYNITGLSPNTTYYVRLTSYFQMFTSPIATSISVLTNSSTALTATVSLSNVTAIYDGLTHTVTATTIPAGLTVGITYNGSSTVPTNAGSYAVVATVNDPNYQGTTSGNFVISKTTAPVSLSNLTATYDASTHAVTATTSPSGLAVGLTYNGSSTIPTNAGTYAVVATIIDPNYQGTTSGNLVISKAIVNPVLGNLTQIYNGSPQVFTATTTPSGLNITKTYNGFSSIPTNAGTYAVVAIVSDPNYKGTASGSFVISKAMATVSLSNLSAMYDGSAHAATTTTVPSGLAVGLTYNGSSTTPTNAGTYAVVSTITDVNYQGTTSGSLVISKATATVSLNNLTATYNGSTHAATATTVPSGLAVEITYNGSSTVPTNAGTYAVAAIVSDPNYQGTTSGSFVISKATATVSLSNLTATYNGSAHAVTATTVPAGLSVGVTYDGSSSVPTSIGTYAVVATISDANYQGTASGSLVISKATATVSLNNLTATYNGSTHAATATTVPSGLAVGLTYNGSSTVPTNAGTYAVAAIVSDPNYQGTTSGSFVISKATATVSLSNLTATYNGSTHAATATTVPSGLTVGIMYDGSSSVPTSIGSYAVVATISDANYQGTASGSLEITSISTNVTGQLLNDVQLYPNPSKDVIWVRASVSVITKISVMNLNGVTVFEKDNCTQLEPLDISNLAKGVYVVCVDSKSGRGSYRVIVY